MMSYATVDDLVTYLHGAEAPEEAERLLDRASELVDYATRGQLGELLEDENLDPDVLEELEDVARRATVRQVEYWLQSGEDVDFQGRYKAISLGSLSLTFADGKGEKLAPRARRVLVDAGLYYRGLVLQ